MNLAARLRNQLNVNQTMIGDNLMDISYLENKTIRVRNKDCRRWGDTGIRAISKRETCVRAMGCTASEYSATWNRGIATPPRRMIEIEIKFGPHTTCVARRHKRQTQTVNATPVLEPLL
jgi:hypothetical protein